MVVVFVDAPHVLTPADLAETFGTPEELGAAEGADADPSLAPRGWWKVDAKREHLRGIEETFAMLRDLLAKDTYAVSWNIMRLSLSYDVKFSGCFWIQVC